MGLSSSKSKTKTDQTTSQTTNPITPPWATQPIQSLAGKIEAFSNMDPSQFVAPPSAIQQQVFDQVGNLGQYTQQIDDASAMAKAAGALPAGIATASLATAPKLGAAGQAGVTTYNAPQLGQAAQTGAVNLAPIERANSESLLTNLNAYMDPYTNQVVDTTLANYDADMGRAGAALAARAASSGAFGGSRYGMAEGQFQADAGRDRAQTEYGLRSDAFRTGAQLSNLDADRRQGVNIFNTGSENSRNLTQGQMDLSRLLANTGAQNQFKLAQGGFDADAAAFGAGAQNAASMFNTGQANAFASQQAALDAANSQFNAGQSQQVSLANLAAQQAAAERALSAAGLVGNLGIAGNAADATNLGLAADIGAQQRAIEVARLNAIPTQLQLSGALLGGLPYPAIVGQQSDGTMQGTTTTTTSPGIGQIAGGLLGSGLAGWASGGFKF